MAEFTYELRIPQDRIAVLIGKKGEIKNQIESLTNTKIKIDSKEGDVFISGEDAVSLYSTKELIRAIGRGFNPDVAQLLLKADYVFELISLNDFIKTKADLKRIKGRVIGQEGKSRRIIEELTETYISVYGKTISIIGEAGKVALTRHAIESLLKGSPHSNVYTYLEGQRREMKKREFFGETDLK